ncbi:MAG: tripartite tricarboxylate transporter TctB family protein [Clostridiales bacterium]|nr:tripartite tricarboxylate transporter TctB family protein [Clostridiales bacterium]
MFFKKYGDIVVGIIFMVISAAMILMALQLPKSAIIDIGPEFMPLVIGGITFALAAALTVISVIGLKGKLAALEGEEAPDCDYKRVISSFILMLIYVFVLQPVGFIISTLVYLFLQIMVLSPADQRGKKQIIQVIIIDILFTVIVFFLFRYGFKIILPTGLLNF